MGEGTSCDTVKAVLDVQHFVVEDEPDCVFGNSVVIEDSGKADGVPVEVIGSERSEVWPCRPGQDWFGDGVVEIFGVDFVEHLGQVVDVVDFEWGDVGIDGEQGLRVDTADVFFGDLP